MFERALSFGELVSFYQLARSEGLVLRYLSDAYRAIRQTVPAEAQTEELLDLIAWLGELVRQVDSSLVDEWDELIDPVGRPARGRGRVVPPPPPSVLTNRRAFLVLVRNELFRRVQLAALESDDELAELDPDVDWPAALDRVLRRARRDRHRRPAARSPRLVAIDETDAAIRALARRADRSTTPRATTTGASAPRSTSPLAEEAGTAVVRVTEVLRL